MEITTPQDPMEGLTPSGFHYIRHIRHDGPKPQPGDYVSFHVIMSAGDTVHFDSDRQARTPVIQIPLLDETPSNPSPIIEGLALMTVGDSITVEYKLDPSSKVPVVYRLALKQIMTRNQYVQEQTHRQRQTTVEGGAELMEMEETVRLDTRFRWKQYRTGMLRGMLLQTPSGLEVLPIEGGTGEKPKPDQWVRIHYFGILLSDGREFVNTIYQGREFSFQSGKGMLPPGIEEGALQLGEGGRSILFVPWQLGYGEEIRKNIPPRSDLVVYVEVMDIVE